MLEKFGVHITPFLGAGGGKGKGKVVGSNAVQAVHKIDILAQQASQFSIAIPDSQDMALVLVLVQDNSSALNNQQPKNRLQPPQNNQSK